MKYLLDTCVISELIKPAPTLRIIEWINQIDENNCFLSVLTLGELHKGINKLPISKKRTALESWLQHQLQQRFTGRILDITPTIAEHWGKLQGIAEKKGKKLPVIDSLIAVTALTHHLTIATRNIDDIKNTGAHFLNPWQF